MKIARKKNCEQTGNTHVSSFELLKILNCTSPGSRAGCYLITRTHSISGNAGGACRHSRTVMGNNNAIGDLNMVENTTGNNPPFLTRREPNKADDDELILLELAEF